MICTNAKQLKDFLDRLDDGRLEVSNVQMMPVEDIQPGTFEVSWAPAGQFGSVGSVVITVHFEDY